MEKIYYIPTNKKMLSLTFDDGPSINTLKVLDILHNYNVKATFFLLTTMAEQSEYIVEKIINDGHKIELHGFDHRSFNKLDQQRIKDIIHKSLQYLKKTFNITPSYIRPPFGSITPYGDSIFKEFNLKQIGWTTMTKDWHKSFITDKYNEMASSCQPGK